MEPADEELQQREKDGEKLVDLEVKCTNQNGQDTLQGTATVALN